MQKISIPAFNGIMTAAKAAVEVRKTISQSQPISNGWKKDEISPQTPPRQVQLDRKAARSKQAAMVLGLSPNGVQDPQKVPTPVNDTPRDKLQRKLGIPLDGSGKASSSAINIARAFGQR